MRCWRWPGRRHCRSIGTKVEKTSENSIFWKCWKFQRFLAKVKDYLPADPSKYYVPEEEDEIGQKYSLLVVKPGKKGVVEVKAEMVIEIFDKKNIGRHRRNGPFRQKLRGKHCAGNTKLTGTTRLAFIFTQSPRRISRKMNGPNANDAWWHIPNWMQVHGISESQNSIKGEEIINTLWNIQLPGPTIVPSGDLIEKCKSPGEFQFVFSNEHAWLHSLKVRYRIWTEWRGTGGAEAGDRFCIFDDLLNSHYGWNKSRIKRPE